jgi:sirohydrochlorin cobaltochelatase
MKRKVFGIVSAVCLIGGFFSSAYAKSKRNAPVGQDKEILVVSFGTSYNTSRTVTIGGIESAIRERFPDYKVARAFTAETIIKKLKKRDGIVIDNVQQALDRAVSEGVRTLIVQPSHLMDGLEYNDLKNTLAKYESKFDRVALAAPLLSSDADYEKVADIIAARAKTFADGKTALCCMGHGTEAESNKAYAKLQGVFDKKGYSDCYVGTVEASPSIDDVLASLKAKGKYKKVVLMPLMVVAGDHANNDMAGDDDDSWKSLCQKAGYSVDCILEGLGQNYDIQQIYVAHTQAAIDSLRK